ncbi:outer membrane beta-barrel protein [uncultured Jannaschia sp.]|uniref:outer membrane protein n=1 Tax=uncultured Jannaschia sp. TaxID=293347 RepID=UPI00262B465E|nr:outer membrane beta-barrel protein [uncultured Jannaschia sp.]
MQRVLASLAAMTLAAPAFAGNIAPAPIEPAPVFSEPAPVGYDWTGYHVGAQIGYADAEGNNGVGDDFDDDGFLYGLGFGYDYDLGNYVLGVAFDYIRPDLELGDVEVDEIARLGARAGYGAGRNLVYGTAGYALGVTDSVGDSDGYFAGVGYEVFATEKLTVGTEVIYHKFDSFSDGADAEGTTAEVSLNFRF